MSACSIGDAAEILALVAELLASAAAPGCAPSSPGSCTARAPTPPRDDWLVSRIPALAAELHGAVAAEGISIDPGLDRYRSAGAGW